MAATKAPDVETRVKERIEKERKELQAERTQAEKARNTAMKEHAKADQECDKLSTDAISREEKGEVVTDEERAKIDASHRKVMATMGTVIAAGNKVARLGERLEALDDPQEFKRRMDQAERLDALHAKHQPKDGEKVPRMTGKRAAELILQQAGKPMHYREITRQALEGGLIKTAGKTPDATMNALLATSAKAGDTFVRIEPGVFGLAEVEVDEKGKAAPKKGTAKKETAATPA